MGKVNSLWNKKMRPYLKMVSHTWAFTNHIFLLWIAIYGMVSFSFSLFSVPILHAFSSLIFFYKLKRAYSWLSLIVITMQVEFIAFAYTSLKFIYPNIYLTLYILNPYCILISHCLTHCFFISTAINFRPSLLNYKVVFSYNILKFFILC